MGEQIKKDLDMIIQPVRIEVDKIEKVKKPKTDEQMKKLREKAELMRKAKATKQTEKLTKGEEYEYSKPDTMKKRLRKLDKMDDVLSKISDVEKALKDNIVIKKEKEIEKPVKLTTEEKQEPVILNQIKVEDPVDVNLNHAFPHTYKPINKNVKKSMNEIKNNKLERLKDIKPIVGKKNNPFLK